MYKAFVVVRNIECSAQMLSFVDFSIRRVGTRFKELEFIPGGADPDDWVFEKSYNPPPVGSLLFDEDILRDIEDTLLLLRLYKIGDLSFTKGAIVTSNSLTLLRPYRSINDLNSDCNPSLRFRIEPEECPLWKVFAENLRKSQSWTSDWFATARRYFLSGGAKRFAPDRDDVDRIVDYTTALESVLVPERDFNTQRIRNRAAALIGPDDPAARETIIAVIKRFYDIRSHIVHGSRLNARDRKWLQEAQSGHASANWREIEVLVRRILFSAVQKLPAAKEDRRVELARLYDPTDEDRAKVVIDRFNEVKTLAVRKSIASKIAGLSGE